MKVFCVYAQNLEVKTKWKVKDYFQPVFTVFKLRYFFLAKQKNLNKIQTAHSTPSVTHRWVLFPFFPEKNKNLKQKIGSAREGDPAESELSPADCLCYSLKFLDISIEHLKTIEKIY